MDKIDLTERNELLWIECFIKCPSIEKQHFFPRYKIKKKN